MRQIEIGEFVPNDDIEAGLYFKSTYHVQPEHAGAKPYDVLGRALKMGYEVGADNNVVIEDAEPSSKSR